MALGSGRAPASSPSSTASRRRWALLPFASWSAKRFWPRRKIRFASVIAFRRGDQGAVFLVRQALRADAGATISALRKRGLDVMILSGDRSAAVESAARVLGVDHWRAEMKPDEKIAFLQRVQVRGHKALMVGDGLNDAPCARRRLCFDVAQ